jgi:hypothetical protein
MLVVNNGFPSFSKIFARSMDYAVSLHKRNESHFFVYQGSLKLSFTATLSKNPPRSRKEVFFSAKQGQ